MREFFEIINEYTWTTILLCLFILSIVSIIKDESK